MTPSNFQERRPTHTFNFNCIVINDNLRWWIRQNWTHKHFFSLFCINVKLIVLRLATMHSANWLIASCIRLLAGCLTTTSVSVTSSTNLNVSIIVCRSLINIRKTYGPNHVTCGIPPVRVAHAENVDAIFTRCWRFNKNECIHLIKHGWIFSAVIFASTVKWSTWS